LRSNSTAESDARKKRARGSLWTLGPKAKAMKRGDEFAAFRRLVQEPSQSKESLWALAGEAKHNGQYECSEIAIAELRKRFPDWYKAQAARRRSS
jgi:hypothetical protein